VSEVVTDLHTPQGKTNYRIYDRIEYPMATKMEKQELEQVMEMMKHMMARLDTSHKKIKAWGEKLDADSKAMREERMKANMDACMADIKDNRKETMACLEETEARLEVEGKPASVDTKPEVAHEQEVPREDAEVMPVGEPRKRRRDQRRNLVAVRRQKKQYLFFLVFKYSPSCAGVDV
jgi:hypothetical protein